MRALPELVQEERFLICANTEDFDRAAHVAQPINVFSVRNSFRRPLENQCIRKLYKIASSGRMDAHFHWVLLDLRKLLESPSLVAKKIPYST